MRIAIQIITLLSFILQLSCVQKMRDIAIHFEVDMTSIENIETVGVIGEYLPLSWETATHLTDKDGDGIYEGIITLKAAYNYAEFKFMLNNEIIELEGRRNRKVDFTNKTEVRYQGVWDMND